VITTASIFRTTAQKRAIFILAVVRTSNFTQFHEVHLHMFSILLHITN
jgi:hypothetical protein